MLRTVATTMGAGVLLFCASCTGEGADEPADWRTLPNVTATGEQSVSSSSVRSSESSTPTSMPSTGSTSVPTSETTSSPTSSDSTTSLASASVEAQPTTAVGSWPADFTEEQIQWTTEAKARWDEYRALYVQAFSSPSTSWGESFKKLSLAPLLETDLRSLYSLADNGVVQTGFPVYEWVGTQLAEFDRVELALCLDRTTMAAHYPSGEPIPVDLTQPRLSAYAVIVRDSHGSTPWMVVELHISETAC